MSHDWYTCISYNNIFPLPTLTPHPSSLLTPPPYTPSTPATHTPSLPHPSTQNFRTQITTKQPDVDTMLALGRAIIAEPNTNPQNDTVMQKLTSFIEDWSDLQLAWQNWYDELHANLEQSKNLSDQLSAFGHSIKGLEPPWTNLFPATVTMENLDTELQELQVRESYKQQLASMASSPPFLLDTTNGIYICGSPV